MTTPNIVPPGELLDEGWVQEANRLFFHPRGLALAVDRDMADGFYAYVYDARTDPEGWVFGPGEIDDDLALTKAGLVNAKFVAKQATRIERFGWIIQPVPDTCEWATDD